MLNMHAAKTHLSEHVAKLKPGDRIVLCRRNQPIAEIVSLAPKKAKKRPLLRVGLAKGEFKIPEAFFDPLPDEVLDAFEGT